MKSTAKQSSNGSPNSVNHAAANGHGEPDRVSILIADDHGLMRHGLRSFLEEQAGWKVIAQARDGLEAHTQSLHRPPDIIVMDIDMPGMNGLETARHLLKSAPDLRILLLHDRIDEGLIEKALRIGVLGYVLKVDTDRDLIPAVRALMDGRTFFPAKVLRHLGDQRPTMEAGEKGKDALTLRESEIVQLLAAGQTNKDIAQRLNLSQRTVELHRAQIMRRLGLNTFAQLVRYAVRNGFIEP